MPPTGPAVGGRPKTRQPWCNADAELLRFTTADESSSIPTHDDGVRGDL
jgi:hypothetical protein